MSHFNKAAPLGNRRPAPNFAGATVTGLILQGFRRFLPSSPAVLPSPLGRLAIALFLWAGFWRAAGAAAADDPWRMDFRYAPPAWQTSICLPDDWQKTLVGKDGSLLYDYPGKYSGFGTRLTFGLAGETQWLKQELASPRVPIVRTRKQSGALAVLEEAFAVAPPMPAATEPKPFPLERVGSQGVQAGWAKPPKDTDPAFRNIAVGYAQPVQYRFPAARPDRFTVGFGLCEGWHTNAGQRILELQIEGRTLKTVDMFAAHGRNVPQVFAFPARDDTGDGWIDVTVAAADKAKDKNTILNVLWIFREGEAPPPAELLAGQTPKSALAHLDCGAGVAVGKDPRHDVLWVRLQNDGPAEAKASPALKIDSESALTAQEDRQHVLIGASTVLFCPQPFERAEQNDRGLLLHFPPMTIAAGRAAALAFGVVRGRQAADLPRDAAQAETLRQTAAQFWQKADLPYDRLKVPDAEVQAVVDSAIRNIYQAREIKKGLPAFQVGPTCYRGLWVVDGSFLLEAITYLGRAQETRKGIEYLMGFQRNDGGIMLIDGHWKETGIALWAVTRHARLTGDREWLRQVWPKLERGFAYIGKMRRMPAADALNAGLIPDGFSDGGLADKVPEYTNIYWTLVGMRAVVEAARWLGLDPQAAAWQREYDDFYQVFRRAAERDQRPDAQGNRYMPIRMKHDPKIPPQKAQWGFLHSVFPGQVYAPDDPLVRGNMAMLKAVERQGLVFDTGWLKDGLWTYFASFYGHAWLWLGDGDKAARTLYAFGNHASPLLVWREEQMPVGAGNGVVGDMPHNWASAEFIRLTRHCLALERGQELHLFEGFPAQWAQGGSVTKLTEIATAFGPLSLEFEVAKDGATGELRLVPPRREPPQKIVWHLDHWSGQTGAMELPTTGPVTRKIKLAPPR